ncbi:MAG: type IV pilus secretin PilQ, partial [Gammaproteobacteria bacterium]|nr:type IV pilus secretin PilQ [Gammaproteobacteria bacterium]
MNSKLGAVQSAIRNGFNYFWGGLVIFSVPVLCGAAELSSLSWEGDGDAAVALRLDGQPTYQTTVLDGGTRQRISFDQTTLGRDAVDVEGRGVVKGIFPYLSDDGQRVHVDILLQEPREIAVTESEYGYRIAALAAAQVAVTAAASTTSAATESMSDDSASENPNVLREITYSPLPGGRIQIDLRMDRAPEEPGNFSTNKPPRVALDFFDTASELVDNVVRVGKGAVDSIVAVSTNGRTRIVLNLVRSVSYESKIHEGGMTLIVASASSDVASPTSKKSKHFASASERPLKHSINRIDFRRSKEGAGRIIVDLSDTSVGIDIREEAGEIIVDFLNTAVSEELERRLDVVDFATPVQTIDTFGQGKNTRMVVTPVGQYQQQAFQAGNVFTIQVAPIVVSEDEVEVDEFGYSGEKLSLNFQKISVRAALQVIADFTGLNFVTSDAVSGDLTLRLQDVPWDQALDIILQTKGLAMRQKGNVVWVAPAAEVQALERQQLEASKEVRELEPLVSELIQINYAKAGAIAKILKSVRAVETGVQQSLFGSVSVGQIETEANSLLSARGNVTVDRRTNTLLIQDTAGKIREVRKLIAQLDKPVRQVLVETRIVEANDDFSRTLGARLGFQRLTQDAQIPGSTGNIGTAVQTGSLEGAVPILNDNTIIANTDGLNVDLAAAGLSGDNAASYALSIAKLGSGFLHLINLEISALEATGKGKIVASPRLITANQQKARIEQGQ